MILDLHVHTDLSGDAKPAVSDYVLWISGMREQNTVDGFVITEHRYYSMHRNAVLAEAGRESGIVILQGVELETDYGHLLIYGVSEKFLEMVDVTKRTSGQAAAKAALETGGVAIPAHPFRSMVGGGSAVRQLEGVTAIEQLNGANDRAENKGAADLMKTYGYFGTGGSDAHFVSDFGLFMTRFEKNFSTDGELVEELKRGNYAAIYIDESRHV